MRMGHIALQQDRTRGTLVRDNTFTLKLVHSGGTSNAIGLKLTPTSLVCLTSALLPSGALTAHLALPNRTVSLELTMTHSEPVTIHGRSWLRATCGIVRVIPAQEQDGRQTAAGTQGEEMVLSDLPGNAAQNIVTHLVERRRLGSPNGTQPLLRIRNQGDIVFTDGRRVKRVLVESRVVLSDGARTYTTGFKVYASGGIVATD